jgi:hypothetical protein
MRKRLIVFAFIPILSIYIYSLIFKLNIENILFQIDLRVFSLFLLSYILYSTIVSIRDSRIASVNYITALKARLLGNAFSLFLPGWSGSELIRAIVYLSKSKVNFARAFSYSLSIAFYDVVIGAMIFIPFSLLYLNALLFIFILYSLINILSWIGGFVYIYMTAERLNKVEKIIFNKIKIIEKFSRIYLISKNTIKRNLSKFEIIFNSFVTILAYSLQALGFMSIVKTYEFAFFLNQLYLISLLVPTPNGAGARELALSIYLEPSMVVQIIMIQMICASLGFLFIGDINLKELKMQLEYIFKNGNIS